MSALFFTPQSPQSILGNPLGVRDGTAILEHALVHEKQNNTIAKTG
jgi:hypothetical protein